MIFTPTERDGAFVIDLEPIADERGYFARAWCRHVESVGRLEPGP
jgi:dTDP-4-dehydrorhamnose 3,5-epimerase